MRAGAAGQVRFIQAKFTASAVSVLRATSRPTRVRQTCHVSPVFRPFPPHFLSAVKVFEVPLADPNAILAVVYVDRIPNKSNTNKKTKKQIELTVVFNSFEVDVITAERLRR